MKTLSLILVVLILFSGCTSVPRVDNQRKTEEGIYIVRIDLKFSEGTHKYAINEFVKSKKGESYDMELIQVRKPIIGAHYYEYKVTIPGSVAVEDMSKEKVNDGKKTEALVTVITVPIAGVLTFFLLFWWLL